MQAYFDTLRCFCTAFSFNVALNKMFPFHYGASKHFHAWKILIIGIRSQLNEKTFKNAFSKLKLWWKSFNRIRVHFSWYFSIPKPKNNWNFCDLINKQQFSIKSSAVVPHCQLKLCFFYFSKHLSSRLNNFSLSWKLKRSVIVLLATPSSTWLTNEQWTLSFGR